MLKGKRAENVVPYAYPGAKRSPKDEIWLDGPNAGKTLAQAPEQIQVGKTYVLDPNVAAENLLLKKLAELGDLGQLTAHSKALGYMKQEIDGKIGFAQLVKEEPHYFPRPNPRPSWLYPFLFLVGMLQLILLLVVVAHLTREGRPTLPGVAAVSAPERVEAPQVKQGRVAPFPEPREVNEKSKRSRQP